MQWVQSGVGSSWSQPTADRSFGRLSSRLVTAHVSQHLEPTVDDRSSALIEEFGEDGVLGAEVVVRGRRVRARS